MYKQLVDAGWSVNDIENTDFELLMSVIYADKKVSKEVPLDQFVRNS